MVRRGCQLLIISLSNLCNSSLAIQTLTNGFICLHELVKFPGQFIILVSDDLYVVVERVNFNLQIGVVVEQGGVAVSSSLEFFAHVDNLVLFGPDFKFKFLDVVGQLNVASSFFVNSLLQLAILSAVLLFQALQVV